MRYGHMVSIIAYEKAKSFLEIGTNKGVTAKGVIKFTKIPRYVGFDLFDMATEELMKSEDNKKSVISRDDVLRDLEGHGTSITLIMGDTKQTLPAYVNTNPIKFDAAFIDGGHSRETILSDWINVRKLMNDDGVVFFDDYYTGRDGGCNFLVDTLPAVILPATDNIRGVSIRIAAVRMKDMKGRECIGYM